MIKKGRGGGGKGSLLCDGYGGGGKEKAAKIRGESCFLRGGRKGETTTPYYY